MNWKQATVKQLEDIAYHDTEAHWVYKAAAEAELLRRQWTQNKQKAVYG